VEALQDRGLWSAGGWQGFVCSAPGAAS